MVAFIFQPLCGPTWERSRLSHQSIERAGKMRATRRADGAVERAGLENRNTRKRIVGSNPTLSAKNTARFPDPCKDSPVSSVFIGVACRWCRLFVYLPNLRHFAPKQVLTKSRFSAQCKKLFRWEALNSLEKRFDTRLASEEPCLMFGGACSRLHVARSVH